MAVVNFNLEMIVGFCSKEIGNLYIAYTTFCS